MANPVPSDKLVDLQKNAQTTDTFVNSDDLTVTARPTPTNPTGKVIRTLAGIDADVELALQRIGVQYSDPIKDWAPSLLVDAFEAHRYPATTGDIYIPTAPLPFTTGATFDSGNWTLLQGVNSAYLETVLSDYIAIKTLAEAIADTSVQEGDYVRISDRGYALFKVVTLVSLGGGILNGYNQINIQGSPLLALDLIVDAGKGVSLVAVGVKNGEADNHLRMEAASSLAFENKTHINPDHKDVCNLTETPLLTVPISSLRPIRDVVFEQSDNSKSVLSFVAGMDFFHMHNFWARYADDTQVQTAPAVFLTEQNHNAKFSHIHTTGGSYGIHSDQISFWQSYEHCRCDNYDLAQIRIDGDRNDLSGGGTTINITNCGGFNSNANTADAALVLNSIGEVNIRTYESGQGKMRRLCIANSVFNLNIQSWHWELSEIIDGGFNLANCQAKIDGLYMQDINIPAATTVYLIENFKSTIQISNITKRGTAPDGTLNLMEASDAQVMTLADACIELSGEIQLDSLIMVGTYQDATGGGKAITGQQLMLVDAPKIKTFNIANATPNVPLNFPFNGSKPTFMEIILGGTTQGVTNVIDGSTAKITELSGGNPTSSALFKYRWQQADGTQGVANQDIQIICHYPKGWYQF